jgi:hypothetical protein
MRRPQNDVDTVLAVVLATAGAFASFSLLQAVTSTLDGSAIGRLAPAETLGRLWVFFVLMPAVLMLVGVGFPCLLRTGVAMARGSLGRDGVASLVVVAGGAMLVVVEAAMQRSGSASLVMVCALCLWRLRARASDVGKRLLGPLLACASAALLGFGVYQQRLLADEPASVAVAPTLFLAAYYLTLLGVVMGALSTADAHRTRAATSLLWLATYAAWLTGAHRWGVATTYVAGIFLGLLAAWLRAASRRGVDERGAFL